MPTTFREILLSAGVAGLLAALLLTLLQAALITPLILQAETFEGGAEAATATGANTEHHVHADGAAHDHAAVQAAAHSHDHHDADEWRPAEGLERTLFTLASNVVMGFGYALMLVALYVGWRRPTGIAQGLLFGLAGFAVFFAAPGLGLPPELPGTRAAELGARQQWWLVAALSTAVGLALLSTQKNMLLRVIGVAIVAAPHLVGAPHPALEGGLAPAQLQARFRLATTLGNAAFWLALGAFSAVALRRFSGAGHVHDR